MIDIEIFDPKQITCTCYFFFLITFMFAMYDGSPSAAAPDNHGHALLINNQCSDISGKLGMERIKISTAILSSEYGRNDIITWLPGPYVSVWSKHNVTS